MNSARVLIVEDDANQRSLYCEELRDAGYQVQEAEDGRQALLRVQENRPDLVILDINMPVMDGLDTLSRLLELDRQIKVVINTAYPGYQDSFTTWSADAYVLKSSDLDELMNTVRRLLHTAVNEETASA